MAPLYRTSSAEQLVRDWCAARLAAWHVPHTVSVLDTSLGPTHVVTAGSGPGVCVYLPGTNLSSATSLPVLEALASRSMVVCPDLPGQPGLSSPTRPADETAGYAAWLGELVAHVRGASRVRRLVVAGHSRGAAVALCGPTDVDALTLLSPAGLVGVRLGMDVLRASVPWLLRPSERRSRALLTLMSGPGSSVDEALVAWMTLTARHTRPTGAPDALPDDLVSRWRGRPVRVVTGEHDCFFPAARVAEASRERLGVKADVLRSLGHLVVEEDPDLVADRVLGMPDEAT